MSFGFSAGDFIASIGLIKNVIEALKDARGSVAEVEALLSTLKSLQQAVLASEFVNWQCGLVEMDDGASLVAKAVKSSIEKQRRYCDEILDGFIKSLKPCDEAFRKPGGSSLVQQARKITWLFRKDDALQTDRNLARHLVALEMYCKMLSNLQSAGIQKISSATLSNVLDIRANVTTILSVIRPRKCIPAGLGYSWEAKSSLSDTVLLLDAIGRSVLLPMMLLISVEDLHGLLIIMYRNISGEKKIVRREYSLTDENTVSQTRSPMAF
ncbi:hypothetical protein BKA65DRAFT_601200 [Rhexocercosporidium sp. MPI-PUGE-AT-0058]|nr:hypothetical protein BKA65DRAFT_601200 [Rhexocercosporidium sp. MPI-PUGE-AT-0058]